MKDVVRIKELCGEAWRFGCEFRRAVGRPAGLRDYAVRYGKAFRRAGVSLRDGLGSDSRFNIYMDARGRYCVDLGVSEVEERLLAVLAGGPLDWAGLTGALKGSGINIGDLIGEIERLRGTGRLLLSPEGVYSLVGV